MKDADQSINLGSIDQPAGNPYLDIDLIVRTAVDAQVDAIHPGYGYLSENAKFADAVREAGLIFIGPTSAAMLTLGDKRTAKDYLRQHDPRVPLIPGFAGEIHDSAQLEQAAARIGYPVMLKASAGGGGRGMRIVHEPSKLKEEFTSAQSEAARSFGSGDCIIEKYIEAGKHIEFQIVGDSFGNVICLWDRECSIQRRHQKVIEESPSRWLTSEKRRDMGEVAVRVGKLLGYENAGTVEFVFDVSDGSFYFLEMNTRLQVEHPITEEVTGLDIVSLQFYVAAGGNLLSIEQLRSPPQIGHAIECRLCAEDPGSNFFPEHGTVRLWQPATLTLPNLKDIRFETALETGSQVSIHFDSMIAKVVVWAPTRSMAIQKAITALSHTVCIGVKTNQRFLQNCLLHRKFREPDYTTSFIPNNLTTLLCDPYAEVSDALRHALMLVPCVFIRTARRYLPESMDRRPFQLISPSFRNQRYDPINAPTTIAMTGKGDNRVAMLVRWVADDNSEHPKITVKVQQLSKISKTNVVNEKSTASLTTDQYNSISNILRADSQEQNTSYEIEIYSCKTRLATSKAKSPWVYAAISILVSGKVYSCFLASENLEFGSTSTKEKVNRIYCHFPKFGTWFLCECYDLLSYFETIRQVSKESDAQAKIIKAPMPCKVLGVLKGDGEEVKAGEVVMVVESMKMEMNISASLDGILQISVKKGDAVNEGGILCQIK